MVTVVKVPTTTRNKGRPVIKTQMKLPNGTFSEPIEFNYDTGASWATDVPLSLIDDFGGVVSSSARKEQPGEIKIEGFGDMTFKIPIVRQDKAHYDLFRDEPPPTRFPLCRVRDLIKYMSFIYSKEETVMTLGTSQPQELRDAVAARKTIPRLADMKRRSGTPTSGWQWYKSNLVNPKTGEKVQDWFGVNTGDRRAIVKRSICDKIKLSYPDLGTDGRADTNATIVWTESKPLLSMDNITIQVRDDDEAFARGGTPRNLIGGPAFLDKWKIVLWSEYLHLAFIPR
jgi:hypothetical protein